MIERCRVLETPPAADWDGSFAMESK